MVLREEVWTCICVHVHDDVVKCVFLYRRIEESGGGRWAWRGQNCGFLGGQASADPISMVTTTPCKQTVIVGMGCSTMGLVCSHGGWHSHHLLEHCISFFGLCPCVDLDTLVHISRCTSIMCPLIMKLICSVYDLAPFIDWLHHTNTSTQLE